MRAQCSFWRAGCSVLLTALFASGALGGDWPQILGPTRSGVASKDEELVAWPESGPKSLWSRELGEGFAGPAVADKRVVIFHRVGEADRIEAWDAGTGRGLWRTDFPASYAGGINSDTGPRCVPLIDNGRVIVFGAGGQLHCVALSDGRKLWSRNAKEDFNSLDGYFGAGSSPIIVDGRLLVNVGGRDDAGLVALAPETGKTLWKATSERASYSSPIEIRTNEKPLCLFVTRLNAIAVVPGRGEVVFRSPFGRTGPTVNAATPIVFDNHLFLTASYGIGAKLLRIDGSRIVELWANDDSMSSQYNTPVFHDGFLYGIHGREDVGAADLRCVAAKTGKVQWSVDGFGVAHLIRAGGRFVALTVDGKIVLAEASPQEFKQLATAQMALDPGATTRALPAMSDGKLFARSTTSRGGRLYCFQVGKQ